MDILFQLQDVAKHYLMAGQEVPALRDINLVVNRGEFASIVGPSGSGKTTLMHILGCLDVPSRGTYMLGNLKVSAMGELQLTRVRREQIGFVFQNFNLITTLTALENVALPLAYQRMPQREQHERAEEALRHVGLTDRMKYRPNQLSGGQQQRVAIARAIVTQAPLILADEPTGNLDSQTGHEVLKLFDALSEEGHTIVMITHDREVALRGQRMIEIKDGRIVADREVSA
ncbi:ABC transporter ATP-binding protein [Sulfobacillus harzensis]|uniref:ABC transporter ATP-binding protein n=1 Tax=Sulfobacillus harzensis TaxID=2729629 RepID=A0A7Y0L8I3_9FIRM|nr:ABC transporter ATP-binding protein [Sulfobacillus harzensis]NMP24776.1 ABC transporter ATP-binding protein [Sulfobacillus harzensis]